MSEYFGRKLSECVCCEWFIKSSEKLIKTQKGDMCEVCGDNYIEGNYCCINSEKWKEDLNDN